MLFISYARSDESFADKVNQALIDRQVQTWIDDIGIRGGDDWPTRIAVAIEDSTAVLAILSPNSVTSKWVRNELEFAEKKGKNIIPILFKSCSLPGWYEIQFGKIQRIDFTTGAFDGNLRSLIDVLSPLGLISVSTPSYTPSPPATAPSVDGEDIWALVMSENTGFYEQTWYTRTKFPEKEIKEGWDADKHITSLSYGDGVWAMVMSKGSGYSAQMWRTRTNFPEKEIDNGWDEGKHITALTYGNGVWALAMSKGTGYSSQMWRTRTDFPENEIKEGWDEGRHITSLTYGNGVWALVMSKGTGYSEQTWSTRVDFPNAAIKEGWDAGKRISSLAYGNGVWALVMSKGTGYTVQTWYTNGDFPNDEIKEGWDSGKDILLIANSF